MILIQSVQQSDQDSDRRSPLFGDLEAPSRSQIRRACAVIQASWNDRERALRRIRAQMALRHGTCRNH